MLAQLRTRYPDLYDVESVDSGVIGAATGAVLMADGITVMQSPDTAAHILILRRQ